MLFKNFKKNVIAKQAKYGLIKVANFGIDQ